MGLGSHERACATNEKLGELDGEELYEALRDLEVDVDSGDGDSVRVFCE
jgi:hypothetical protein